MAKHRSAPGTPPPGLEFGVGIPQAPTPSLGGPFTDIATAGEAFSETLRDIRSERELEAMRRAQLEFEQEGLEETRTGRRQRAEQADIQREFDVEQKELDRQANLQRSRITAGGGASLASLEARLRTERQSIASNDIMSSVQLDLATGRDPLSFVDFKQRHGDTLSDQQIRTAMRDGKLVLLRGQDALDQQILEGLGGGVGALDLGEVRPAGDEDGLGDVTELLELLTPDQRLQALAIAEDLVNQGVEEAAAIAEAVRRIIQNDVEGQGQQPPQPGVGPPPQVTVTPQGGLPGAGPATQAPPPADLVARILGNQQRQ